MSHQSITWLRVSGRQLVHICQSEKYLRLVPRKSTSSREVNFPTIEFEDLILFVQVEAKYHWESLLIFKPTLSKGATKLPVRFCGVEQKAPHPPVVHVRGTQGLHIDVLPPSLICAVKQSPHDEYFTSTKWPGVHLEILRPPLAEAMVP
jgi:hypothetical protein